MKEISSLVLIESNALGVLCKNLRESNGVIKFCDEVLINFVKNKINIIFLVGNWYWETFFSMPVLLYMYTVMSQVAARILKSKDFNFKVSNFQSLENYINT